MMKSQEIQLYNIEKIILPENFPQNSHSTIGQMLDSLGRKWGANLLLASDIYRKPYVLKFDEALYDFTSKFNSVPTLQHVPGSEYNWLWFKGKATCSVSLDDIKRAQEKTPSDLKIAPIFALYEKLDRYGKEIAIWETGEKELRVFITPSGLSKPFKIAQN